MSKSKSCESFWSVARTSKPSRSRASQGLAPSFPVAPVTRTGNLSRTVSPGCLGRRAGSDAERLCAHELVIQVRVDAAAPEQLGVGTSFDDAAVVEDQHLVRVYDRAQAVGDDEA